MICDLCLIGAHTHKVGFYLDENNVLHTDQTSNICLKCLSQIRIEIIGTRDLRRVETASYKHYSKRSQSPCQPKK